jgi:alpha-galactosidase
MITSAFPAVEIEVCAGGGGRIDAGIARRTHRFWTSDNIDAVSRLRMQPGFLHYMPPELMGSHVGTAPAHATGRTQGLDFRAANACQGHFGVEFNLLKLGEADSVRLAEWISFYKANRHLLHAETWGGTAADTLSWHAAGGEREWLLFVYREAPTQFRHAPPIRLPFVARNGQYRVTPTGPTAAGDMMLFDGSWLSQAGLPSPPLRAEAAAIYRIERL